MRVLACHRRRICLSLRDSLGELLNRAAWADGGLRRVILGASEGAWLGEPHRLIAFGDTHFLQFHLSLITLGGDLIITCFSIVVSSTQTRLLSADKGLSSGLILTGVFIDTRGQTSIITSLDGGLASSEL